MSFDLRNTHEYGETYEAKRLRLRSNSEDPEPGTLRDLPTDRHDEHTPVPWWAVDPSFKRGRATPESLVMVGSRSPDVAPRSTPAHGVGAADPSAAGGPGRTTCPPAAHPTDLEAA